jgi:hypothetical protein
VGPVDIFRAIREQGRDRVADLFLWKSGAVTFYRGHTAPHVEFPLDLDLPTLMLAGLEAAKPGDSPIEEHRNHLDRSVALRSERRGTDALSAAPGAGEPFTLDNVIWPTSVARVQGLVKQPTKLRDLLQASAKTGGLAVGDLLRGLEILHAAGLVAWEE